MDQDDFKTPVQRERAAAMAMTTKHYDTPHRPCGVCNGTLRYTKSGKCVKCQRGRVNAHQSKAPGNRRDFSCRVVAYLHPLDLATVKAFIEGVNATRVSLLPPTKRQQRAAASAQHAHPGRPRG